MHTTVNVDIQQSSLGPRADNRIQIDIHNPNFRVRLGEFRSDFSAHKLMAYQDTLDGTEAEIKIESHRLGIILSEPKGTAKKEYFQGNDSQGPFVLSYRPTVPGSETVSLNDKRQIKGQDYTIDYSSGEIRFLDRIILREDRIVVLYETENTSYKDQVWGLKYDYSLPSASVGVAYLHKRETRDTAFVTAQQGLGHYQWNTGPWHGKHEFSYSHVSTQRNTTSGMAFFTTGGYKTASLNILIDGLTTSPYFQPISSGLSAGDYNYGADAQYKEALTSHHLQIRHQRQRYTDSRRDTRMQYGIKHQWDKWNGQATGIYEHHTTNADSGNTLRAYTRYVGNIGTLLPFWIGNISEQIQMEKKQIQIGPEVGFTAYQTQTRWELDPESPWKNVVEATLRRQEETPTRHVDTQLFRWTSAYTHTSQSYIQAIAEQRYQTGSTPSTLANISSAISPMPNWTHEFKLSLESLKETYNTTTTDVGKWDIHYVTSVRPMPILDSRYTYKRQFKALNHHPEHPYDNQEFLWDTRLALWGNTVSLQQRERTQRTHRLDLYPTITPEGQGHTQTTIARLQSRPFPRTTLNIQGEWEVQNTVNNSNIQRQRNQRLKSEFSTQIDRHTAGLTADIENKETETTLRVQRYGTYIQFQFLPSTVRCELSFSHHRDSSTYEGYSPSIAYSFRPSSGLDLSIKYSLERLFQSGHIRDNSNWDLSAKIEIGKIVTTASFIQDQQANAPERVEAYLKISYVF